MNINDCKLINSNNNNDIIIIENTGHCNLNDRVKILDYTIDFQMETKPILPKNTTNDEMNKLSTNEWHHI